METCIVPQNFLAHLSPTVSDLSLSLKGNMHRKYVGSRDAFYIIDLAAEIFYLKISTISKEAYFVPSLYHLIQEKEK